MMRNLGFWVAPFIERICGGLDETVPVAPLSLVILFSFFDRVSIKAENPRLDIALRNQPGEASSSHGGGEATDR